ncbi:TonB-dependent receptor [Pedobacter caeni]|nr:TonB-dependent receptor [Pedobacter caeni]
MLKYLSCFFLFLMLISGHKKLWAQEKTTLSDQQIRIDISEGTLGQYLNMIVAQGVNLSYSSNQLRLADKIKLNKGIYKAGQLLKLLLSSYPVEIKTELHKIILYIPQPPEPASWTLSGFIYSGDGMEALPYASMRIVGTNTGTQSNEYGFYTIKLPAGINYLQLSYSGYSTVTDTIQISASKVLNFKLKPGLFLAEVEVRAPKPGITNLQTIDLKTVNNLPMALGETDPLKAIQLKSGVSGGLIGGNMYVRGGSPDQNLVLLDGIPVYNYNHFTGILSIFNNDAVKHIDFYKGGFPSRYEGRLSSVIDVKTKDGDMQKYHGAVNIGLLTSSAMIEGPLIKNKVSFLGSFRRSWIDGLTGLLYKGDDGLKYYLYDANLKINYRIDSTNRIYLSAYKGNDRFSLNLFGDKESATGLNWSNQLLSFRWNKVHNPRLFHNSTLSFSEFKNQLEGQSENGVNQFNKITDFGIDNDLSYSWNNDLKSYFGVKAKLTRFQSAPDREIKSDAHDQQSVHLQVYTDNDVDISAKLKLKAGLHYTAFLTSGKTYHSFQPRTRLTYTPDDQHQLYASYSLMAQFYHQITINAISMPNEFRAPSTAEIPPQRSAIYEIGYLNHLSSSGRIGMQLYRKDFSDLLMYRPQQNAFDNKLAANWNDRLLGGKGYSQGFEIEYAQDFKWLTINAAYTFFKTMFIFEEINNGKAFKAPQDLRNQFTTAITINLGSRWSCSTLFTYSSGMLVTLPDYALTDLDLVLSGAAKKDAPTYFYATEPNNYRLPDNYSLNVGAVYHSDFRKQRQGRLHFGINNILGKPLPFQANASQENNQLKITQTVLFKLLPYVGYSYSF